MNTRTGLVAVMVACLALCASAAPNGRRLQATEVCTPYNVIKGTPDLKMVQQMIDAAGFADKLNDPAAAFTLFAPNPRGVERLLCFFKQRGYTLTPEQLLADKALLSTILNAHIVPNVAVPSSAVKDKMVITTASPDTTLTASVVPPNVNLINTVTPAVSRIIPVVKADVGLCKAVAHVVERAISPPEAALAPLLAKYKTPVPEVMPGCKTIAQVIAEDPSLSRNLLGLETSPDFKAWASDANTVGTLFVANNDAIAQWYKDMAALGYTGLTPEKFLADPDLMKAVLYSSSTDATLAAGDLCTATTLYTRQPGVGHVITQTPTGTAIGSANVVKGNLQACRAMVHVVDKVTIDYNKLAPLLAKYKGGAPPPPNPQPQPQILPVGPAPDDCAARGLPPNDGVGNKGCGNVGNYNEGDFNVGSNNKGNKNTGSNNVGDCNVGSSNVGSGNTGSGNNGNGPNVGCAPPRA